MNFIPGAFPNPPISLPSKNSALCLTCSARGARPRGLTVHFAQFGMPSAVELSDTPSRFQSFSQTCATSSKGQSVKISFQFPKIAGGAANATGRRRFLPVGLIRIDAKVGLYLHCAILSADGP
jgi:hypothetical protein